MELLIDIRLQNSKQLFDNRDPAPFRERDLDAEAVEYLVSSVEAQHSQAPVHIVVRLMQHDAQGLAPVDIENAMRSFFRMEESMCIVKISKILRHGRTASLIGLSFLLTCVTAANLLKRVLPDEGILRSAVVEGIVIIGWVAMWKPFDLLLYDWWPVADQRKTYKRLSEARIEICYENPAAS